MKDILDRICIISEKEYIRITSLEKKIGASKGVLSRAIAKKTDIQTKWIQAIVENYPQYSASWLLVGKGPMLSDENKETIPSIVPEKLTSTAVPFYNLPVSAGPLGILTYNQVATKPDGYIDIEAFRRCDAILPVTGISMEPEIHSGDLIGIKKMDYYNWEYIQTGKIYMIITHEDRMIKYISKADDSEYIICSSPNYHDFKVRKDDILEVYRVIASVKSF